ncbi:MAG: hypothetical protein ACT4QC_02815 [Planctomycetaceae bacterium]
MTRNRTHWNQRIDQVIRSRHYTWLGEGLGGEAPSVALGDILADVMHICARQGIRWEELVARSRVEFEAEEARHAESALSEPVHEQAVCQRLGDNSQVAG